MALEEILFLDSIIQQSNTILEIGAGYGRSCHAILSLYPNVKEYNIIDLPEMLKLSSMYLENVSIKNNYRKINFIPIDKILPRNYDLVINIDSMQEMEKETSVFYLDYINQNSKSFYCKNTVGKYLPENFGWKESESSQLAINSGLITDIIDILCPDELKNAQKKFLEVFTPGKLWKVEKHDTPKPWTHYYQALYRKHA